MSASSKKQFRKEQASGKLTEKQLAAQKEAATTRLYTIAFTVVLVALLTIAVFVGVKQTIKNSGFFAQKTMAVQVGDHSVSNAELNYYFVDAINYFYSTYGSNASMIGMDASTPLDQQVVDEETGRTWADDFMDSAKQSVKNTYAMVDAAEAAGYTLPEDKAAELDNSLSTMEVYAKMYGFSDGEAYLKAMYGSGATKESFLEYSRRNALADAYYDHYTASLTYTEEDLRAKEAENFNAYSSYSYHSYYLPVSSFQVGGTTDENGKTIYTAQETAAAEAAAKAAADTLVSADIDSVEALDAAIAALPINKDTDASSTANKNIKYDSINSQYQQWVTDSSRKEGDKEVFYSTTSTTDEAGNTVETLNGCHVVYFLSATDNKFPMANVRHILIKPTHAEDEAEDAHADGESFSAQELAAAKKTAEDLLAQWKSGEASEESFALLANEHSADGDGTTGGLYENVTPGQMVAAFNDWCFDSSRKSGDTGIVQTEYGFHVMYFVGNSTMTYRDYQIESELRSADAEAWHEETLAATAMTEGSTKYIRTNLVLKSN